jgi:large repetitive protein
MPILGAQSAGTKGSPTAPTIGTVTLSGTTASVPFTAPSFSKLPVTSYIVTSSPGGLTGSGASSPITVTGLSYNTAYTFTVTATSSAGTSAASSASNSVTPTVVLGGTGPGGGKVFYDAGSTLSWGRYLEAATSASSPSWTDSAILLSNVYQTINAASGTAIGTGKDNTTAFVTQGGTQPWAAQAARNYTGGGFSGATTGWFLPSKDELNQLYIRRADVGTGTGAYWSSSAVANNTNNAWYQFFGNGNQLTQEKGVSFNVRPIRSF